VAFLCGFHREAVTSAAVALERFHEFLCFVLWNHIGVAHEVASAAWKPNSRRSEKQAGMLVFNKNNIEKAEREN